MVYTCSFLYDDMDVDGDYVKDIIPLEVPIREQMKIYIMQGMLWLIWMVDK